MGDIAVVYSVRQINEFTTFCVCAGIYADVKDAADLQFKIDELEAKPLKYKMLSEYLANVMLKDEYYDGSFLTNKIHMALK